MMSFAALDRVALIDDNEAFRSALAERLELAGLNVSAFGSAEAALKVVNDRFDGVVVTDLRMPGMDGRQLVERLTALDPDLPVVMMTGHGDIAEAVEAMKRGAYDFLAKPFAPGVVALPEAEYAALQAEVESAAERLAATQVGAWLARRRVLLHGIAS